MALVNQAALLTLIVFGGLTLTVFVTKMDFSGLGPYLAVAAFALIGIIVAGILFNFGLGLWISFACIALAAGYILYNTSNILHHYRTDEHVAASLELFADVALLFYHILRVLMFTPIESWQSLFVFFSLINHKAHKDEDRSGRQRRSSPG
jgi:FtsH-binding integral membrane protein